ncbi:MAG: HAD-IIIC family phosphatase [Bacteroidota bacterium]
MYETEIYIHSVKEALPEEVVEAFQKTLESVKKRSLLHWTEHCTECAMPACFKTCDLYTPRIDGKCQRFVNGMERVETRLSAEAQILKIQFKKWGVYATQGNNELYEWEEVSKREKRDLQLAKAIHLAQPAIVKKKLSQKRYSVKKKGIIAEQNHGVDIPDVFIMEVYNPSEETLFVGLTIRNEDPKYSKMPFQFRLELKPGYNKEMIPFDEIAKRVKTEQQYRIDVTPENISREIPLYFGMTEFAQLKEYKASVKKGKKIKCVVWDLDNTIWNGVLVEDGVENLVLKPGIKEILTAIEERGILNSVVSKNTHEAAWAALEHFGLAEFFLFPQISWLPKSKGIKEIALDMNVNVNTFLFVDDSVFERNEVEAILPQVRIMDSLYYQDILKMEELQVPVTAESKKRKLFYLNEAKRKAQVSNYEGEYFEFLRNCELKLEILPLKEAYFPRVYELTQRTNQMNFSGNRYTKEDIQAIYEDEDRHAYVLSCSDQFGEYGIIGFALIKGSENRLIDLMFSCRIQSKRVEHAFLTFALGKYLAKGDFWVSYNHTEKNKFSAQVFNDFEFEEIQKEGAFRELKFGKEREIPNDQIISVVDLTSKSIQNPA